MNKLNKLGVCDISAVTVTVTTTSPAVVGCHRGCLLPPAVVHVTSHSITSIIQSFIYKCNNSNRCKWFYLDYKSMLIQKLPQTPYMAFPLDWQIWAQENAVYSAFSKIYFMMSDRPCWETKYYIVDLDLFPFMSPIRVCTSVFKFTWSQTPGWSGLCWWGFLQAGQIQTRQR